MEAVSDPPKNWFAVAWTDPVGSKLIAVALASIATGIWGKLSTDAGPRFVGSHEQVAYWTIVVLATTTVLGVGGLARISRARAVVATVPSAAQPRISLVTASVTQANPADQRTYPVKIRAEFRNDSQSCIDVSIAGFTAGAVTLEKLVTSVLQLKIESSWLPLDEAERIAVLPGQMFRLWLGVEKARFTSAEQVTRLLGAVGKLMLMVNGDKREVSL
jgi:hypothetical protein